MFRAVQFYHPFIFFHVFHVFVFHFLTRLSFHFCVFLFSYTSMYVCWCFFTVLFINLRCFLSFFLVSFFVFRCFLIYLFFSFRGFLLLFSFRLLFPPPPFFLFGTVFFMLLHCLPFCAVAYARPEQATRQLFRRCARGATAPLFRTPQLGSHHASRGEVARLGFGSARFRGAERSCHHLGQMISSVPN